MLAEETRKANCEVPLARDDGPKGDTIYVMTAVPRKIPKAPPVFPNPAHRTEGTLLPLVFNIISGLT